MLSFLRCCILSFAASAWIPWNSYGAVGELPPVRTAVSEDDERDLYRLGTVHYSRGQWKYSIQRLEKLLEVGSDEKLLSNGRFYLAESYVAMENYVLARRHLIEFLRVHPNHQFSHQARYRLGEVAYLQGDLAIAAENLNRFVSENREHELLQYAYPYLAEINLKSGDLEQAQLFFEKSLAQFPEGDLANESRFGLARVLEKLESADEASRFYRLLLNRPESGRVADSLLQLGKLYFRNQDFSQAKSFLQRFEREFPKHELINPVRYWQGRIAYEAGDFESSIQSLGQALNTHPSGRIEVALRFELARAQAKLYRHADALVQLDVVLEKYPDSEWADRSLLLAGQILHNTDQFERLLAVADRFEKNYPQSDLLVEMLDLKAAAWFGLKRYGKAAELCNRIQRTYPADAENNVEAGLRESNRQYLLALSLLRQDRQREARTVLEKIDLDRSSQETRKAVLLALSAAQTQMNQLSAATDSLEQYLTIDAESKIAMECISNLVTLYAKRDNYSKAASWLKKLEGNPLEVDSAIQLAEIAYENQRYQVASRWFAHSANRSVDSVAKRKALMGLVWSQKELGSSESVMVAVDRLVQSFPESSEAADALLLKAVLLDRSGRSKESISAYEQLAKNESFRNYHERALLALARHYRKAAPSKLPQLVAKIRRLLESEQTSQKELRCEQKDRLLYELAWALLASSRPSEAAQVFRQIHEEYPESGIWGESTMQLAAYRLQTGSQKDACFTYQKVVKAGDSNSDHVAEALFQLGKIYFDQKKFTDSARVWNRLSEEHPASEHELVANYWAAEATYLAGESDDALKRFVRLSRRIGELEEKSRQDKALAGKAPNVLLRCAQLSAIAKSWDDARDHADSLIARFPDYQRVFEAHYVIGRALASKGKFTKARESYSNVLKSKSAKGTETAAMAQWMIGETWFHQEDFEKAIDAYQHTEILHDYPTWKAAALLQAGKCFEQLQQYADALESYRRILSEYQDSQFATEASDRISQLRANISSNPLKAGSGNFNLK